MIEKKLEYSVEMDEKVVEVITDYMKSARGRNLIQRIVKGV